MHRGAVAYTLRVGLLVACVLAMCACGEDAKPLSVEYSSLSPGRYLADEFQPALSFEVGKGWEISELQQKRNFEVLREYQGGDYYVAISFLNPPSRVSAPSNPNKLVPAPKVWVSWFQEHPYLETSEPQPTSVGGVQGRSFDTMASSLPEDYTGAGGVPLWPLPLGVR